MDRYWLEFTHCPDCRRKGVALRLGVEGDGRWCRYCGFGFWLDAPRDACDVTAEERWRAVNPEAPDG